MKLLLSLFFLTFLFTINVESQPLADAKSGYINFFVEMLNPSFRQHRARLRPFVNQIGSPVNNIRGARDVSKQLLEVEENLIPKAECLYSFESLICSGLKKNGTERTSVECKTKDDFTDYAKINKFAIGDIRIFNSSEGKIPIVKLYLYGKIRNSTWDDAELTDSISKDKNVFSIHFDGDNLADKGLTVVNHQCWVDMVKFFLSLETYEEIKIKNSVNQVPISKSIKTIADLQIL